MIVADKDTRFHEPPPSNTSTNNFFCNIPVAFAEFFWGLERDGT